MDTIGSSAMNKTKLDLIEHLQSNIKHEDEASSSISGPVFEDSAIKTEEVHIYSEFPEKKIIEISELAEDIAQRTSGESINIFRCYLCTPVKHMQNKNSLNEHLSNAHPLKEAYHCDECNIPVASIAAYNQHLQGHDVSISPYKCKICSMRFSTHWLKRQHEVAQHQLNSERTKRTLTSARIKQNSSGSQDHNVQQSHDCLICDATFNTNNKLQLHMRSHKRKSSQPSTSKKICKDISTTIFNQHLIQYLPIKPMPPTEPNVHAHLSDESTVEPKSASNQTEVYATEEYDTEDGTRFYIKLEQSNRLKEEGSNFDKEHPSSKDVLKCYLCSTTTHFKDVDALNNHLEGFHPHKSSYQCQECNATNVTIVTYNRHLSKHDATLRPHKCDTCPSRFSRIAYLRQHEADIHLMNNGRTNRRWCSKCKTTVHVTKCTEHACSHADTIHICLICDMEFSLKKDLNKHVTSVHDTAPTSRDVPASHLFRCYLCEPATDMEDDHSLQEHLLASHPRQDDYHCTECDKRLHKITTYNQHLQRHDASLCPFKCSQCPLRFRTNGYMRQHEVDIHQVDNGRMKRLLKERRRCRVCRKTIILDELEEHMKTEHPANIFVSTRKKRSNTHP